MSLYISSSLAAGLNDPKIISMADPTILLYVPLPQPQHHGGRCDCLGPSAIEARLG
jgi:hypothetical protein